MTTIYTISNPMTMDIKYIGMTTNSLDKRLYQHLRLKHKWIKYLTDNGIIPLIEELEVVEVDCITVTCFV